MWHGKARLVGSSLFVNNIYHLLDNRFRHIFGIRGVDALDDRFQTTIEANSSSWPHVELVETHVDLVTR